MKQRWKKHRLEQDRKKLLFAALLAVDLLPEEIRRRIQTGKCRG